MNKRKLQQLESIIESAYKLERKLSVCVMTLKLERETHVPDLMTRIRILPAVAVVAQKSKVARFFDGDAQLQISIKFLARTAEILKSLEALSKMIKNLPGVKSVGIDEHNKRKITLKGKKIIF
jgi:hypothetical protein